MDSEGKMHCTGDIAGRGCVVDTDFTEDLLYNKTIAIKGGVLYGCYCNQKD